MATQLEQQVLALTQALQELVDNSITINQLTLNDQPSQYDEVGVWSDQYGAMRKIPIGTLIQMIATGNPVENTYDDIAEMLSDQNNQTAGFSQVVNDSSADETSGSTRAVYAYIGIPTGSEDDYIRMSDKAIDAATWQNLEGDQKDINLMGFTDGNIFNFKNFQTDSNNTYFDIATDNKGVWIATSYDGTNRVLRSDDDGHTWTEIQAPSQNQWLGIDTDGEGTWVSVNNSGGNRIMRSVDNGITWTDQPATGGEAHQWVGVTTDKNGTWIAVATNGNPVIRSIDNGVTWSIVPQPVQNKLDYVHSSKDGVFIASDWLLVNLHITKDYGDTWEILDLPISRVSFATDHDQIWVMAIDNSNQIYISRDNSETWNTETIDIVTEDIRRVRKLGEVWAVITDDFTYYSHDDLITFEKSNEVIPIGNNMATSKNGTTIIVSKGNVNVSRIEDRKKFENIVNQYQINGTPITPVNKVLNIVIPEVVGGVQSVTGDGVGGTPENIVLTFPTAQQVIGLTQLLADKKDDFSENTAFNRAFGISAGTVTEGNDARLVEAFAKKVNAISVTGDTNKTITITREDGTTITASFLDNNDPQYPDDVINTLNFNLNNDGVLVAVTSEGEIISVSLDGRYSLLGHVHTASEIQGLDDAITNNPSVLANTAKVSNTFTVAEKNKLASITEIFTTALKNAYDGAVTWISTNGANLLAHLGLTNNPHNVTLDQTLEKGNTSARDAAFGEVTATKFIDSNGTDTLTGAVIDLSNNIDGTIYNEVTPSDAISFSVVNLKAGGYATNYIDTTGMTDFPDVTNASGAVIPSQRDAFRADAQFEMVLETLNGVDVLVYFLDYLNLDPIQGKSAYQVWLDDGNSGSVQDFLDSLKGDKGDPGSIPARVGCSVNRCGTIVDAGTWTVMEFDIVLEDTNSAWNGSEFTVPVGEGGMYEVFGHGCFSAVNAGSVGIVGVEVNDDLNLGGLLGRGVGGGTGANLGGYGGALRLILAEGATVRMVSYCANATDMKGDAPLSGYNTFSIYKMQ